MKRTTTLWSITTLLILFIGTIPTHAKGEWLNPIIPGDHADPTFVKINNTFYATSTSYEWAPAFPIYKSNDLEHWELVNYVFPNGPEDTKDKWARNRFWAPELQYDSSQKKIYVYYTSGAVDGILRSGIASIDATDIETGKFIDHGPIIEQNEECGAIDAFELILGDKIYAIWKSDGNGCNRKTYIWAQEINKERNTLLGKRFPIIGQTDPWEERLIEGACFFQDNGYIYGLYSAGRCCGPPYNYRTGIARVKKEHFLDSAKWEKYPQNPILETNDKWVGPGHGTVVKHGNRRLFILHAYSPQSAFIVGRETILEELTPTSDQWFNVSQQTSYERMSTDCDFYDTFSNPILNKRWQWISKEPKPIYTFQNGLLLQPSLDNNGTGAFLGTTIYQPNYNMVASLEINNTEAGIGLGGAFINCSRPMELGIIGLSVSKNELKLFSTLEGRNKYKLIASHPITKVKEIELKMQSADNGNTLHFSWRKVGTKKWNAFYTYNFDKEKYIPSGMGFKIGMFARGESDTPACFKSFRLMH